MSKRYATVNSLGAETPMPLLDWLIHELDIDQSEMRNVSACFVWGGAAADSQPEDAALPLNVRPLIVRVSLSRGVLHSACMLLRRTSYHVFPFVPPPYPSRKDMAFSIDDQTA